MLGPAMPSHRPQNLEFDTVKIKDIKGLNIASFESTNVKLLSENL